MRTACSCRAWSTWAPPSPTPATGVAVRAATELLTSGTYDSVADGIAYDTMNEAVTPR
ncbi:MAG: hypothetical protein ACRDPD_31745 [Streptosporangiaceae bacterium]